MSTAQQIVDALLEGKSYDPRQFIKDFSQKWGADYHRDENGWYHVNWSRGFDLIEDDDLKLSQAQIKWLEEYANWLDSGVFPFDVFMQSYKKLHSRVTEWFMAAQKKGWLNKYIRAGHPMPPIDERPIPDDVEESDYGAFIKQSLYGSPADVLPLQSGSESEEQQYGVTFRNASNELEGTIRVDTHPRGINLMGAKMPKGSYGFQVIISGLDHEEGGWNSVDLPFVIVPHPMRHQFFQGIAEFMPILKSVVETSDAYSLEVKEILMQDWTRLFGRFL